MTFDEDSYQGKDDSPDPVFFTLDNKHYFQILLNNWDFLLKALKPGDSKYTPGNQLDWGNVKYRSHTQDAWDIIPDREETDVVASVKPYDRPAPGKGSVVGSKGDFSTHAVLIE